MYSILFVLMATFCSLFPAAAVAGNTGSLSGVVLDAETGSGVDDVQVVAEIGVLEFRGITDDQGRYTIPDLRPGNYALRFIATKTPHVVPAEPQLRIAVERGKRTRAPNALLPRGCTVTGAVLTAKKNRIRPLSDAIVEFDIQKPKPEWGVRRGSERTKYQGGFGFNGLPAADEFVLSVKVDGHADIRRILSLEPGRSVSDLSITVAWDDPTGISGTVRRLSDRWGISDVRVLLINNSGEQVGRAITNYYGEFSIVGIEPGAYTATVYWQGGDPIAKPVAVVAGKSSRLDFEFSSDGDNRL